MLLSEAIDNGLADPNFRENRSAWLEQDWELPFDASAICGCAAGAAFGGRWF